MYYRAVDLKSYKLLGIWGMSASVWHRGSVSLLSFACSPWFYSVFIDLSEIHLPNLAGFTKSIEQSFHFALYAFFTAIGVRLTTFLQLYLVRTNLLRLFYDQITLEFTEFITSRIWESILNSRLYRGLFKIFGNVNIGPSKSMLSASPRGMTVVFSWLEPRDVAEIHGVVPTNFLMLSLTSLR